MFAAELSQELIRRGHLIVFAGLYPPPENVLTVKGANNIDLNGKKMFINPFLLVRLLRLIKKEEPDVVQANGSDTLKYAVLAGKLIPGLKITYRNISMVSSWSKKGSWRHQFNQWLFGRVNFVTSVGANALQDLISLYGYEPVKAAVIRRGIPDFPYVPALQRKKLIERFGFSESDRILMHVGQFSPEKNHSFLLSVFVKIKNEIPAVKLIMIGEGATFRKTVNEVKQWQLENDAFFAGYQQEVQSWLSGADLFLLTSTIEGVPGVILEAGMQGVPAVAVKVGGVGEVIRNGETGLMVERHDEQDFTAAVLQLLRDETLRKKCGQQAATYVKANYSVSSCAIAFEKIYEQLKNGK